MIPDTVEALDVLDVLRNAEVPLALVHDEYGHFEGARHARRHPRRDRRGVPLGRGRSTIPTSSGARMAAGCCRGSMPADEMAEQTGIPLPPNRDFETVAGLVLSLDAAPAGDRETRRRSRTGASRSSTWTAVGIDKILASRNSN